MMTFTIFRYLVNFCRFIGPLPKAARSKRLRPKRPLISLRDFVCPRPGDQTARRIAMKLGRRKCLRTGLMPDPRNSRIDIPFSRKREISLFRVTVPALGAIFSDRETSFSKSRRTILRYRMSFELSPFAARYPGK